MGGGPSGLGSEAVAPPHGPSTTTGMGNLQWYNLEKRLDISLETNSQDSLDHGVHPMDVERGTEGTENLKLVFCILVK